MKSFSAFFVLFFVSCFAWASDHGKDTDWLSNAQMGAFMHFLPDRTNGMKLVKQFDIESLATQLKTIGARYFVFTLGQNSGYFNSPNVTYDRRLNVKPGDRCSTRDLPLDLYRALTPKGIKLMLYLPCQVPNQDVAAQRAFGLQEGPADQALSLEFAQKWAAVIQEWSDRYGDKVAGWWFDGGYQQIHFNEAIAEVYAKAVKHGNPHAIVTFNPGVSLQRYTQAEDYTAGELNEPFLSIPTNRWLGGSQWHALTFIGANWGQRNLRFSNEQWGKWVKSVVANGGAVTLDMGPNYDSTAGPIGSLASDQANQFRSINTMIVNEPSKRLRRADSFLGIHFDFHANTDSQFVGKNTTPEMVETIINQVHPDYIQTDCKGHPGYSSYPTKVGNPIPGIVGDPLRIWREVTAKHGVSLYMHYSGVWDSRSIALHPDWAVINGDGKTNSNATSFWGPYADRLLIPQLRELEGEYGVDGAWVDGECWACAADYGEAAIHAFQKETGITSVPHGPADPHWFEFLQFNREAFRNYLRHYVGEVKKTNPKMQLCSNWAFTDLMPEPVTAPLDFLSGDYSPQDSVNTARISARYLARQGKPWDLMAWSFTTVEGTNGSNKKSVVQLQREAAVVLSLGGGFQAYFTQNRDGSVRTNEMSVMAEVAKFCRARQAFCHHAQQVPQVALLYSTADHYRRCNSLFVSDTSRFRNTLIALLESQQSVDIVSEHHLTGHMKNFPMIIVPDCDYLEPAFKQELVDYVKNGGNLLLTGPKSASMFAPELGITTAQTVLATNWVLKTVSKTGTTSQLSINGTVQKVTLSNNAKPFAVVTGAEGQTSATSIRALGKGRIAATYFEFNSQNTTSEPAREFLVSLVHELFPSPMVELSGSHDVDVIVNRLDNHLAINLVNTAGPHATTPIFDSIPVVGPLQLTIRQATKPTKITLEPGNEPLDFDYQNGAIHLTVPKLEIHKVVWVQ